MDAERTNKLLDERCEMQARWLVRWQNSGLRPYALMASLLLALLLAGCAAAHKPPKPCPAGQIAAYKDSKHKKIICIPDTGVLTGQSKSKPPRIGAPPQWKPETPFGGHWDCHDDRYQYNFEHDRCELKEKTK